MTLDAEALTLLNKGLKFIPTQNRTPPSVISTGQDRLIRLLKLKDFFQDDGQPFDPLKSKFHLPSKFTPKDRDLSEKTLKTIDSIEKATDTILKAHTIDSRTNLITHHENNLTVAQRKILKELSDNQNIVIKPSDKAGSIVVMNRESYVDECFRQLSDTKYYIEIPSPIFMQNVPLIARLVDNLLSFNFITPKQHAYFTSPPDPRPRHFYVLPKVHKDRSSWPSPHMPPGRPIVSDVGSECYNISQYIDSWLLPLSKNHASYLKDTYDFLTKVVNAEVPKTSFLVSGDVTSLYTNMDLTRTIKVVKQSFLKSPESTRPDAILLKLLEITLRNNDFQFENLTFLQICGLPMGRVFSPSLANLYLHAFDDAALAGLNDTKPLLYYRFLDDIFFIWMHTEQELILFETYLNSLIPGIHITLKYSQNNMDFLDTTIFKLSDSTTTFLQSKIFFKPTATHQLLHSESFHPPHTRKGVLKSQLIRYRSISTNYVDFLHTCQTVFKSLRPRGYSRRMLRAARCQAWNFFEGKKESTKRNENQNILPIVLPYNSLNVSLIKAWRQIISTNTLFQDYKIIAAYKNNRNLTGTLVRSKLPNINPSEAR